MDGRLAPSALVLGRPGEEAQHVHQALGLIDVSTLGKLLVKGPEAGAFLDRLYPNRFSDLKVGRIRYGVLTTTPAGSWTTAPSPGSTTNVLRDHDVDGR